MAYGAGNDSILKTVRDNIHHPEITFLGEQFSKIQIYRDWNFGRKSPMRQSQRADLIPDYLLPDASNLALFLNTLRHDPATKRRLLTYLQELYAGIEDYEIRIVDGSVLVFFQEGEWMIPATRLSDGTLRYLYLLAILCNPNPPPLICIEEPELGLHPDILPTIAKLLVEASERTQLIVTTHSETLVDCMTETPENVLVCEKDENGTYMERLNAKDLEHWMTEYRRLGTLWNQGHIGGNRW
jgi:predicted ATPase